MVGSKMIKAKDYEAILPDVRKKCCPFLLVDINFIKTGQIFCDKYDDSDIYAINRKKIFQENMESCFNFEPNKKCCVAFLDK